MTDPLAENALSVMALKEPKPGNKGAESSAFPASGFGFLMSASRLQSLNRQSKITSVLFGRPYRLLFYFVLLISRLKTPQGGKI